MTRGSPPWCAIISPELLDAGAGRRAPRGPALRPRRRRGSTPARTSIRAASSDRQRLEIARARCPSASRSHSMTSSALPTARPSGASMRVMSASVRTPDGCADRDQRLGERARSSSGLHERAVAALHVEHQAADALGDLLAHDRRGDERDALDRAGDVAQRVELLSAGAISDVWPIMRAADRRRARARNSSSDRPIAEAGDRLELVERAAGVAEPAARHHRHDRRRRRRRAARGSSDILSPTPPVLCLSTLTPARSG